jgi:hypothetical protein
MIMNSKMRGFLAAALVCTSGVVTAQANTLITFSVDMSTNVLLGTFVPGTDTVGARGTFSGDNFATTFNLVQNTSALPEYIYTNTYNDTAEANGTNTQWKFYSSNGSTWETPATGQNRIALLPVTSGASLVLPTPFFGDAGAPVVNTVTFQVDVSQQVNLGNFVPGTSSVEVRGLFNGWTGGVTLLTNSSATVPGEPGNPIWAGTYPVTNSPGGMEAFKYVIQPGTVWDSPSPVNSDGGGNRYFANVAQSLPVVNFNDATYVAALCTNTFSVDMSGPAAFDPTYQPTTVTCNGSFNGWGASIPMTNNPNTANTNVFTTSQPVVYSQGGTFYYQFRYQDSSGTVYDNVPTFNGNRAVTDPAQTTYVASTVYFNNQDYYDYLTKPINVTFTINMTGAVGTDNTVWAPGAGVFVNGPWPNWLNWDPIDLAGQELTEVGSTPIYTGTFTIPAGISSSLTYKYSLGGADNEAGANANLTRVIRDTSTGAYSFPQDTWANQYVEPSFGQLAVTPASGGKIGLSWLGRQGCQVQTSPSLSSPSWVSLPLTDGTNWTVGTVSTNGLVSATNYPVSTGNLFIRLIKY